ncbi:MAG: alpha,alpha-trehalase TreF [Elusimicrobia bacterium]|nr:alpha,alpha-trehalase TreF [Elusimicrobiota bacterium]
MFTVKALRLLLVSAVFTLRLQAAAPPPPDEVYGRLFEEVQLSGIFKDSKAFPDAVPGKAPREILADYRAALSSGPAGFSLSRFVSENFVLPSTGPSVAVSSAASAAERVHALWAVLERPADAPAQAGSLLPLPKPYIVPGGRFREIYYWDSYFTMLGLARDGKTGLMRDMADNFAYLIDTYGHVPNGNRSYYLSRSQPPYFTLMVKLLAKAGGEPGLLHAYLPGIEKEYLFWMDGADKLEHDGDAARRVLKLGPALLNRYWDDNPAPRQEAYAEDLAAAGAASRPAAEVYRDIRAAAESGMDFSGRWFADGRTLASIETVSIAPVDLNCLLYDTEMTLFELYKASDPVKARVFKGRAENRKNAINGLMYDPEKRVYEDYYFKKGARTGRLTLAALYPFFLKLAPADRVPGTVKTIREDLLKAGGVVTSLTATGQQWDSPNGWPPLQWVTVTGLENYGQHELAVEIAGRWTGLNEKVFARTGKMMEKYNVIDTALEAGGGEYPGQDGFGWTNGVYLALKAFLDEKK